MRDWASHSYEKLQIFSDYIERFAQASKRAPERVYLDAFAGETQNQLRATGEEFPGSAELALTVNPPFTAVHLFELSRKRAQDLQALGERLGGGRDVRVHNGDANEMIPRALESISKLAPTFAFLDPDGFELSWSTIRTIADHKRAAYDAARAKAKIEMWILFSTSGLSRMLTRNEVWGRANGFPEKIARLYGAWGPWERIWEAKRTGELSDVDSRRCYAYLYMDRLADLGYQHLLARPVHLARGNEFYVMIFASDHPVGGRIMGAVQAKPRVVKTQPTLFEVPVAARAYDEPWEGWREDLPFELPAWKEL